MTEQLYYVWLSQCFLSGNYKPFEIASSFDDLKQFYEMPNEQKLKFDFLTRNDLKVISMTSLQRAKNIIKECVDLGIKIVTIRDKDYPQSLLTIHGAPIVLYYKGNISNLNEKLSIAIVGTRRINEYSKKVSFLLSKGLSESGILVVSGGAVGVDCVAHAGALAVKSPTAVVMACGIDVNYPSENAKQREEVLLNDGVLISELPPRTGVNGSYFAIRNRIISGLSEGVCLTHSPVRSGTLLTANHAIDQGKELFCVPPSDITDPNCMGVMKFIKDGCVVVGGVDDILSEYTLNFTKFDQKKVIQEIRNSTSQNVNPRTKSRKTSNRKRANKPIENKDEIKEQIKEIYDILNDATENDIANLNLDELKDKVKAVYDSLDEPTENLNIKKGSTILDLGEIEDKDKEIYDSLDEPIENTNNKKGSKSLNLDDSKDIDNYDSLNEPIENTNNKKDTASFSLEEFKEKVKDIYYDLDEDSKKLFDSLTKRPKTVEEIVLETDVKIYKVLSILTEFEHTQLIKTHSGKRYSLNLIN